MKTIDWRDLKSGDIFKVEKVPDSCINKGIYYFSNRVFYQQGPQGEIFSYPGGQIVTCGPKYKNCYISHRDLRLPVKVHAPSEINLTEVIQSLSTRISHDTGSDPEIFVTHGPKNILFPAFRFLPTQEVASKTPIGKAFPYRDGFAAESYIRQESCHGFLMDNIRLGLDLILKAAREKDPTAKLTVQNTFTIPKSIMKTATEEDVALGCMPSLNAYHDDPTLPTSGRDFNLRFAGGHVHLGVRVSKAEQLEIVKGCDLFAAVPAVAIFASIDKPIRRQFYGRAGEYRAPKYGLEYRTLSNAWLAVPNVAHLILNLVRIGAKIGKAKLTGSFGLKEERIREIINHCDIEGAREFCSKNLDTMQKLLSLDGAAGDAEKTVRALRMITQGGIEDMFPKFEDMEDNWKLSGSRDWAVHSDKLRAGWGCACNALK